jgi:hypothetical protein
MMHAHTHRSLAGKLVPDFCRNLSLLDPYFLHALSVQIADYRDDGTRYRWAGATSIAMAIHIRCLRDEGGTLLAQRGLRSLACHNGGASAGLI